MPEAQYAPPRIQAAAVIHRVLNSLWTGLGLDEIQILDVLRQAASDLGDPWSPPPTLNDGPASAVQDAQDIYHLACLVSNGVAGLPADGDVLAALEGDISRIKSLARFIVQFAPPPPPYTGTGADDGDWAEAIYRDAGSAESALSSIAEQDTAAAVARLLDRVRANAAKIIESDPPRLDGPPHLTGDEDFAVHVDPALTASEVAVDVEGQRTMPFTSAMAASALGLGEDDMGNVVASWLAEQKWTPGRQVTPLSVWLAGDGDPRQWRDCWVLPWGGPGKAYQAQWAWGPPPLPSITVSAGPDTLASITEETVLVDHALWDNRDGEEPQESEAEISQSVEISVETHWDHEISLGEELDVQISAGPAESQESLTRSETWGQGGGTSKTVDVGDSDRIKGDVPAGEAWVAALTLRRGTNEVRVPSGGRVSGYALVHLYSHHHGHPIKILANDGNYHEASWIAVPIEWCLFGVYDWFNTLGQQPVIENGITVKADALADSILATHPIKPTPPPGPIPQSVIDAACGVQTSKQVYP